MPAGLSSVRSCDRSRSRPVRERFASDCPSPLMPVVQRDDASASGTAASALMPRFSSILVCRPRRDSEWSASFSPVKIEFAPARKQSATASCDICRRPAASRTRDARHQDSRRRNRAHHHERIEFFAHSPEAFRRCAHQHVDRHALRMRIEMRQLLKQADAVFFGFAHSQNSAAAHGDARLAHVRDRLADGPRRRAW